MTTRFRPRRSLAALTAVALGLASAAAGAASADAAPVRTAATSTDTTYLADTLGLPANTVVETVTYDRFQWLLQQTGRFAFLIGDPAEDPDFASRVQAIDAAARTAGVAKVYWFDPNLTGSVKVGSNTTPNLDIRNPAGITTVAAASQTIYGKAWQSLIGQYLGNGITASPANVGSESATVAISTGTATVNDAVSPLYDYSTGTPANASDSTFFIYDKANTSGAQADNLVSSVDLHTDASWAAEVTSAFASAGTLTTLDQFAFWKSEINSKHVVQASAGTTVDGESVLDDSDAAQPWAVQQLTYPELVHLLSLKDSASRNFVILFGGTWCPNTRAVIKDVNAQAQANDVTVYNFDTVLDGGTVGGGTTSASNPLQVRNTVTSGSTSNANPSFVYASILQTYLKNIVTQYDLNNGSYVTFYPNGDTTKPVQAVRKLQVPFLIDYQRGTATNPSSTAIKRQWIQQGTDGSTGLPTFTEYMTQYWYARPGAGRIGLTNAQFPFDLAIPGLSTFDWTNPSYPDTATNTDDAAYLSPSAATATATPSALAVALAAVPGSASLATVADVSSALTAAQAATPVDATLVANLTTIKADWTLAQTRKANVTNALANVAFGLEAVAKLGTFFGGLPGGVRSEQFVTAPPVAYGTAPTVTVAIANDYGRVPTGSVTLTVGGASYTQAVTANAASFTLPTLPAGSYDYTLSYPGDDQVLAFSSTGSVTVSQAAAGALLGTATVKPTLTKTGTYTVQVSTPAGLAAATGTVALTLTKAGVTRSVSGSLSGGSASLALPALQGGTWSTTTSWSGDANYAAATQTGSLAITKVTVSKIVGSATTTPTQRKAGAYRVTITSPSGAAKATGTVTVKLTKGTASKKVTGKLSKGVVKISIPKLAKGTWKVVITWPGDANYLAGSAKGTVKVTK